MNKIKLKRVPTLVALSTLLVGLAIGLVLINKGTSWLLRAEPEITPKQVKITNVSENSFSVSWVTDEETNGFIKYGDDQNLSLTAVDDRDQISGKTDSFSTHHITVRGLSAATNYFFKIVSGNKVFDNNGQEYQLTTALASRSPTPANDVAYGQIVNPDDSPAEGIIIYLSLANTAPLSVLSKSSGNWVIPLNLARSADLSTYTGYDRETSIIEILAQGGLAGTATAVATTKYDSPLPNITLGQSFDFRKPPSEESLTQTTPSQGGLLPSNNTTQSSFSETTKISIINPQPGEQINTQKPEIIGTGPAGETLTVTLNSPETITGSVIINNDGGWSWTPPSDLIPGEHTITAFLANGQSITRSFIVLAAETSDMPSFSASPSGTLTPTATPEITPISTPTPTTSLTTPAPSTTPTSIPTSTPTLSPTSTPTPTGQTATSSATAKIPQSGNLVQTLILLIIGVGLASLGTILIIWSKKDTIDA